MFTINILYSLIKLVNGEIGLNSVFKQVRSRQAFTVMLRATETFLQGEKHPNAVYSLLNFKEGTHALKLL